MSAMSRSNLVAENTLSLFFLSGFRQDYDMERLLCVFQKCTGIREEDRMVHPLGKDPLSPVPFKEALIRPETGRDLIALCNSEDAIPLLSWIHTNSECMTTLRDQGKRVCLAAVPFVGGIEGDELFFALGASSASLRLAKAGDVFLSAYAKRFDYGDVRFEHGIFV